MTISHASVSGGTLLAIVGWNGSLVAPTVTFAGAPMTKASAGVANKGLGSGVWFRQTPTAVAGLVEITFQAPVQAVVGQGLALPEPRTSTAASSGSNIGPPSTSISFPGTGACPVLITAVTVLQQPTVLTPSSPQLPIAPPLGVGPITLGSSRWDKVPGTATVTWTQNPAALWHGTAGCLE